MKSVSHIILATLLGTGVAVANESVNFNKHDANKDGRLSQSEWSDIGQVDVSFDQLDRNGDGMVDKQEVRDSQVKLEKSATTQRTSGQSAQQSGQQASRKGKQAFREADADRDNRVSQREVQDAGYDYVAIYYEPMDADGDGYLDENEWDINETGAGIYDDGAETISYTAETFSTYDLDDDGFLDQTEVSDDDYLESNFSSLDANNDGFVSEDEADTGLFDDNDDNIIDDDDDDY